MACRRNLLILFVYLGLALTSPVSQENSDTVADKNIAPTFKSEVANKVIDVTNNHVQTSIENSDEDVEPDCSNSCEESDTQEKTSLLHQTPRQIPPSYLQPTIFTTVPAYQSGCPNARPVAFGISSYQKILNPYMHPNFLSAYGGYRVNSLPPVLSTYIHGLLPQEEMQRSTYNLDVLSPQSAAFLPTVVRPTRMLRTSDDELLAELQHDAIMNNIIPTMSVPFARYADPAVGVPSISSGGYGPPYGPNGASAIFPGVSAGGCAQPLLFSCTPKIIRGTLKSVAPEVSPDYHTAPVYRHNSAEDNKSTSTVSSPTKIALAPKSSDDKH